MSNSPSKQFQKVFDSRNRPVRGLWTSNGSYYLQSRFGGKFPKKLLLKGVNNLSEAQLAAKRLSVKQADNELPVVAGRAPRLDEYIDIYLLNWPSNKKPSTLEKETGILNYWKKSIGHVRINQITPGMVDQYVTEKSKTEKGRTCDIHVSILNNVLNRARKVEGYIKVLPTTNYERRATEAPKRPLWTMETINQIINGALQLRYGQDLANYLRLLYSSGMRAQEGLSLEWDLIDWERKQVKIRTSKNGRGRIIDFNPTLESVLTGMRQARTGSSKWLFPMPDSIKKTVLKKRQGLASAAQKEPPASLGDQRRLSFRKGVERALDKAGLADSGFNLHDLRHFFISWCVMNGIDYMTIASWVGHSDGGILIGKVYGHLADDHKKAMAQKLVLGMGPTGITTASENQKRVGTTACGILSSVESNVYAGVTA